MFVCGEKGKEVWVSLFYFLSFFFLLNKAAAVRTTPAYCLELKAAWLLPVLRHVAPQGAYQVELLKSA